VSDSVPISQEIHFRGEKSPWLLPFVPIKTKTGWPPAMAKGSNMDRGVNVLALVKEGERYVFLYDDESAATLLQTFGRYAAEKELSFSWYDAAVLSKKVRALQKEQQADSLLSIRETMPE